MWFHNHTTSGKPCKLCVRKRASHKNYKKRLTWNPIWIQKVATCGVWVDSFISELSIKHTDKSQCSLYDMLSLKSIADCVHGSDYNPSCSSIISGYRLPACPLHSTTIQKHCCCCCTCTKGGEFRCRQHCVREQYSSQTHLGPTCPTTHPL